MIQSTGKILLKDQGSLNPVLDALCDLGKRVSHLRKEKAPIYVGWLPDSHIVDWQDGAAATRYYEGHDAPVHHLSDFNLLPGGEKMLTMDDIEVGGKYEVRKDLKVGDECGEYRMNHSLISLAGKDVVVDLISSDGGYFFIGGDAHMWRMTPQMLQRRVDKPKPFKDGDRVVLDENAANAIRIGIIDFDDSPTDALTIKKTIIGELEAHGPTDSLAVGCDGNVFGCDGHVLHAPTFGHLKAGDPNPFVVGMEVSTPNGDAEVIIADEGPYIEVYIKEAKEVEAYGFFTSSQQYGSVSINTIFPTTQQQPAPHEYQFGDKVKSDNGNQWWVVGTHRQLTYIVGDERAFKSIEKGVEHEDSEDVQVIATNRLCPWPEPVRMFLENIPSGTITAIVDSEGVSIGRRKISFEAFDKLAAEVAKIRGNE